MSHPDTDVHAPKPDSFVNNFTVVLLLLVAFAFAIFFIAGMIAQRIHSDAPDPRLAALATERIRPVGEVHVGGSPGPATAVAAVGEVNGEQVYNTACMACHATGAAGAPKLGNADEWAPRLAKGKDVLYQHSIQGFQAMPPKGGFTNLSDEQVKAAVDYMVQAVQ